MKSIYIKASKRECSVSDFKCFDIYDENKKNIGMVDCDVISIKCNGDHQIHMDIVDGMIHIWSDFEFEIEPLINTLIIRFEKNNKDEQLTYEELTALCRKQQEYIQKIRGERTIDTSKPDYEELRRQNKKLVDELCETMDSADALKYSLKMMYKEMAVYRSNARSLEERYYKENDRANDLFTKLEKLKNEGED